MAQDYLMIWINAIASAVILLSVLKLYSVHHANMHVAARVFLASIALSACYSTFEVLAWRRDIPTGMTLFLILLSGAWALRAFSPIWAFRVLPAAVAQPRQEQHHPHFSLSPHHK